MCTPAAVPPGDIRFNCTDEEAFSWLERMNPGSPLPANVMADVNPLQYRPLNLPSKIWYYNRSVENRDMEHGFWKTKGEVHKIFLTSETTGLRTTHEFYEGQAPYGRKTDWLMQEYRIVQGGLYEDSKAKEANSLCRVFQSQNHENQQKLASANIASENHIRPTQSIFSNADNNIGQSSRSQPQVSEDDSTGRLAVIGRLPDHQVGELEYPGDDYLELLDLENPASPSSSENSSCMTMSSNECFDSLALLQELEHKDNQKDAGCKFSVSAPRKPNDVVMVPATSAVCGKVQDNDNIPKPASRNQKPDFRNEGPSSNSRNVAAPLNVSTVDRQINVAAPDGEKMASVGRKIKFKNYLCFMSC